MGNESILNTIKKLLGIPDDYEQFDRDIIVHINSVFGKLNQLGVGPDIGFRITSQTEKWSQYVDSDDTFLGMIQDYIYLNVRKIFDPPTTSSLLTAIDQQITELEFRLNVKYDKPYTRSDNKEGEEMEGDM